MSERKAFTRVSAQRLVSLLWLAGQDPKNGDWPEHWRKTGGGCPDSALARSASGTLIDLVTTDPMIRTMMHRDLSNGSTEMLKVTLERHPATQALEKDLRSQPGHDLKEIDQRYGRTLRIMGTICRFWAPAHGKLWSTRKTISPESFARCAIRSYERLLNYYDEYVSTGMWLELLVASYSIHPENTIQKLEESFERGYIHRYFEGSTPETRYPERHMHRLEKRIGEAPKVVRMVLDHESLLFPGRASTSIKIVQGPRYEQI